ncbi:E3 ubiquitin-protein ligase TRIM39-like [Spea bombifrons]|uniref:E3 ubiquitin-protein ligase TRIM39-like n=1 Tax=Spea bombifrons TaxID=233779 RepID=UPI00234B7994|nr:E3 ubiquitin-protein ligase TRIM39-like [Spea bombifrons]
MASAAQRGELPCPVCQNVPADPVTLACGHGFCRLCLDTAQGGGETAPCPQCRRTPRRRRTRRGNRRPTNTAEVGVSCTYCIQSRVPAAKSCLLCEASLCEEHLEVHSRSADHVLTQPTASPSLWKCSVHKKLLEYYCPQDSVFVCVSCRLDGEHGGHRVETLAEVADKKKERLRGVLEGLASRSDGVEKSIQSLQDSQRKLLRKAGCERDRLAELLADVRERLEALQQHVLKDITLREQQLSLHASNLLRHLEKKKEELRGKTLRIEGLLSTSDPLAVILGCESAGADLWNSETDQGRKGDTPEGLQLGGVGLASVPLHRGLLAVGDAIEKWGQVLEASDFFLYGSDDSDAFLEVPPTPGGGKMRSGAFLEGYAASDLTLDVHTASNDVIVSDNLKSALWSSRPQGRPETPARFGLYTPQVLSLESFSSGRHCWEVETVKTAHIRVGVAYASIERKGHGSCIGESEESWVLQRFDNQYVAIHCNDGVLVPYGPSCQRLGVSLDYEAGRLSFYELRDPVRHLHTFTTTFAEPLHAAFWVLDDSSITIRSFFNI